MSTGSIIGASTRPAAAFRLPKPEDAYYRQINSLTEAALSESGGFSLELGEDLVQTREWLHEFAVSVIRPAAAEWDEREETPWPVLEEAAKIGLYSLDFTGSSEVISAK